MKAPPADLAADLVRQTLEREWQIHVDELVYLPLGFGDHHWRASQAGRRWFVTVCDARLDGRSRTRQQTVDRLERTFRAVRRLRERTGLPCIVPAVPSTRSGALVVPLGETFALSLYEWLDVEPARDVSGRIAANLVAQVHRASRERPVGALAEDFAIPHRPALEAALADLARPWQTGPYAEPARAHLTAHQTDVRVALERYDAAAASATSTRDSWCLTHGEPSGPNLLLDQSSGAFLLVDWESALLAPPERDLVDLRTSPAALDQYQEMAGGPPPRLELIELYRAWYALAETAVYVRQFRAPHADDANLAESWLNFLRFLPG
jgi:aminoglycoside phosphotransferase (APT) family kinase protein